MDDKQCIHYWIVDSKDVGRCRYCGAVKDFGALLRREEREGAGLKTVSPVKSVAAKKQWQDPEYRANQIAARKKRWQDPEYQAKMKATMKKRWQDPEYQAKQSATRIRQHNKIGGNEN